MTSHIVGSEGWLRERIAARATQLAGETRDGADLAAGIKRSTAYLYRDRIAAAAADSTEVSTK